ncbi:MAG TPA: Crp/Fnr family transcriptional regulator [Candidatus Dormibacteraeota bacterium]|nr:Crp/Fnr family transcriptional regulator [Candidatus Dormibacteraeota bacterium]
MSDPLQLLATTSLFDGLAPPELERLRPSIRLRKLERGAYLFREGDPGSFLCVVVRGKVKIGSVGQSGTEVVFAVAGPGDVLGELSLFAEDGERTADAQALEQTECLTLARDPLIAFLSSRPALLVRIISTLCAYIARKDAAVGEIAFLDIPARVALKLLELAESNGRRTDSGVLIDMPLSQRTLAGMVGASRENVNRALSRFADLGYIRQSESKIEILNSEQLQRRGSASL